MSAVRFGEGIRDRSPLFSVHRLTADELMEVSVLKRKGKRFRLIHFIVLTLAGIVNAFGVTVFLAPVKLYDSGISGTSMLLSKITPDRFSLSFFLLVLNVPIFLYGLKKQGAVFSVYSIYAVFVYSVSAWLITDVLPMDVSLVSPLAGDDLLLCSLFGGMISGVGSGFVIRYDGALDGVELLSVIFAKRLGITVGTFVMIYNVVLYIVSGFVTDSWILPLYSLVAYLAAMKTVDFIVEGFDRTKSAIIVTTQAELICDVLSEEFGNGITVMDAEGYYSAENKKVIYFVVNRFQIVKMKDLVRECDPAAFITISEVSDVFGSGNKFKK